MTLSEAQKVFAAYVVLEFLVDAVCFGLGRAGRNNLWISHLTTPIESALVIRAFSGWQVDRKIELVLRRGSVLLLLFWIPPIVGWEPMNEFSIGSESIQAILCLAAAAFTLVRLAFQEDGRASDQAWFWIGAGVMVYFGTYALMNPLVRYLVHYSSPTRGRRLGCPGRVRS